MKFRPFFLVCLLTYTATFSIFSFAVHVPQFARGGYLPFYSLQDILQSAEMWPSKTDYLHILYTKILRLLEEQPNTRINVAINTDLMQQDSVEGYTMGLLKSIKFFPETNQYELVITLHNNGEQLSINPLFNIVLLNLNDILDRFSFDQIEALNFYFYKKLGLPNQFDYPEQVR